MAFRPPITRDLVGRKPHAGNVKNGDDDELFSGAGKNEYNMIPEPQRAQCASGAPKIRECGNLLSRKCFFLTSNPRYLQVDEKKKN